MPVSYDSNKIIPAPFVSIQKQNLTREDGAQLSPAYALVLKGKLTADKGSPNSQGAFYSQSGYPADESIVADSRLASLLRKQEALRKLFSTDGKSLEIQSNDGSAPLKCRPRVKSIEFPEGQWYNTCDFVITMEADYVEGLADAGQFDAAVRVMKVSEEWNIEVLDETNNTYRLSHSLSATGKRLYDDTGSLLEGKQAWEHARDYVLNLRGDGLGLGLVADRMTAPGVIDGNSLQAFNYFRTQAINETAGVFSASETWVAYDPQGKPPAISNYNITLRYSAQDNRTTVGIDGTITGLALYDNNTRTLKSTRWANADSMWTIYVYPNLFATAQALVPDTKLNSVPVSNQVGLNPSAGSVTYHWEYDNRPTPITPLAITENITVSNNNAADVFAQIPVLGRPWGPVLQGMGTVTAKKRTISIDIQMPPSTQSFVAAAPDTDGILLSLMPVSDLGVFIEQDEESWTANTGRYTRQTSYVWE